MMKVNTIKHIGVRVVGGKSSGSLFAHAPQSIYETAEFLKQARDYLTKSDAYSLEVTLINSKGLRELERMYHKELPADEPTEKVYSFDVLEDPYAFAYGR